MKKTLYLILALFITSFAYAQPYKADFKVVDNFTRSCVPFTVTVKDLSGSEADPQLASPFYYYGDGGDTTQAKTYTYTKPGIYSITQFIQTGGNPPVDRITKTDYIEVLPKPQPVFSVNYCQDRIVQLQIEDAPYEEYIIDFGDGSEEVIILRDEMAEHTYANEDPRTITVTGQYAPGGCGESATKTINPLEQLIVPDIISLKALSNEELVLEFNAYDNHVYNILKVNQETGESDLISTIKDQEGLIEHTLSGFNLPSEPVCLIISAADCNSSVESPTICTINHTVEAVENENQISWAPYVDSESFARYLITRNGTEIFESLSHTEGQFADTEINCGQEYCYVLKAELQHTNAAGTPIIVHAAPQCVQALTTEPPPPVSEINSTIEDGAIKVLWEIPENPSEVNEIKVYRSVNGGDYALLQELNDLNYTDQEISIPENTYCYKVFYKNPCNLRPTTSAETCPIILSAEQGREDFNRLSWTSYTGSFWEDEPNYILEKLEEGLTPYATEEIGPLLNIEDPQEEGVQVIRYRIRIQSEGDTSFTSYSNVQELRYRMGIFPPNTFTPNNDGLNDTFEVKGRFVKNYSITIFNKWGEVVYSSTDMDEAWDGTIRGQAPVPGSYAYVIEAEDYTGERINKRGTISIIF
ncbi:gliding motility-associated C-terminal domain-containing protein [Cytophagaceae bacterium ABcell3]|nr:gliding motility-associated C-terminal domain-containing protein [Cytophagaceae bacterium ABcell3]